MSEDTCIIYNYEKLSDLHQYTMGQINCDPNQFYKVIKNGNIKKSIMFQGLKMGKSEGKLENLQIRGN